MELPKSQPKKRSVQFATTALEAMRLVVSRRYDSFRRGCQKRWTYVCVVFLGSRRRVGVRIVFFRKYVPVGVGTYYLYLVVGFRCYRLDLRTYLVPVPVSICVRHYETKVLVRTSQQYTHRIIQQQQKHVLLYA
jgi:hypothetical protein